MNMRPPSNFRANTEYQYPFPAPTTVSGVKQAIIEQVRWLPDVVVGYAAGAATSFVGFDLTEVRNEAKSLDKNPTLEEVIAVNGLLLNYYRYDSRQLGEELAGTRLRARAAGRHFFIRYSRDQTTGGVRNTLELRLHRMFEHSILGLVGPVDVRQQGVELTERMVRHSIEFAASGK